jgi:probable F420-dependent oxidoreductase
MELDLADVLAAGLIPDAALDAGTLTGGTLTGGTRELAARARAAERSGYAGLWTAEQDHDPFLPLMVAAEHTSRVDLGTAVCVAFSRTPMNLAHLAHDLHAYSGGRLILGLGSQLRHGIESRHGLPWSRPVARMREYVTALRAVWTSWATGQPLDFGGDFYRLTVGHDFYNPLPHAYDHPKIYLAGVGPAMTRMAAQTADGLLTSPFTTARHLRDVTLPAVREGLELAGRTPEEFTVTCLPMLVTGRDEAEMARNAALTRARIAFYLATPGYETVADLHGWSSLVTELLKLAGSGGDPATLIDEEILRTCAVVAEPADLPQALARRFGPVADRLIIHPIRPRTS